MIPGRKRLQEYRTNTSAKREEIKASSCKAFPLGKYRPLQGWALESQRKRRRASESVKNFLLENFNEGVKTGSLIIKRTFFKLNFQTVYFAVFLIKLLFYLFIYFFTLAGECSFINFSHC